jgi:transcriptional regulator with PAS, ATPase and Fis domain
MEKRVQVNDSLALQQKMEEKYSFESIMARSSSMQKIVEIIRLVARSNAPILISGESGTGKEMVAHIIHVQSYRKNKPFIAVSCSHLLENQIESELFGCESGVINGGQSLKRGKFELANQGSLFLDEVSELDPTVQVHLLRALEEKLYNRVGGDQPIQLEVRLISATSQDLKKHIEAGQFREDLYYRLGVVNIDLPPLRSRKEDIPVLADYFLEKFNKDNQKKVAGFTLEANDFLLKYEWPGNIREMENAIERAVILAKGDYIEVSDLAQQSLYLPHKAPVGKTMREIEKNHILNILVEAGGNCSEAARLLGISRMTLYNKIKAYGLNINKIGNG